MYQRQGYALNHVTGTPIADGSRLLPFMSMPFEYVGDSKVSVYLHSICGNYTTLIGFLETRTVGTKISFYWIAGTESGLTVPSGYYYIQTDSSEPYQFKTEPFYMPAFTDTLKGSFNDSFNASFDT
jgi:hypothetical protein